MTWPTVPIVTTAMDAGTDTPPRDQIKAMADAINDMIATPPAGGSGRLIGVQVFTTVGSSTYTPTAGTGSVVVEVQGGGGGGGGTPATSASQVSAGQGGGSGAYAMARLTSAFSGVTVTVGAGGTAASGADGGSGGNSSFGTIVVCGGGQGGSVGPLVSTSSKGVAFSNIGGTASVSGSAGSFIVNQQGKQGSAGVVVDGALGLVFGGEGSATKFGPGGRSKNTFADTSGASAPPSNSYGAGAGGSIARVSSSAQGSAGVGRGGCVIVWEYA